MTAKKSVPVVEPVVETPPATTPMEKLSKTIGEAVQEYTASTPDDKALEAFEELIEFFEASVIIMKGFYETAKALAAMK